MTVKVNFETQLLFQGCYMGTSNFRDRNSFFSHLFRFFYRLELGCWQLDTWVGHGFDYTKDEKYENILRDCLEIC